MACGGGAVYPLIANAPHEFTANASEPIMCADIGIDFGGSTSATAFSADSVPDSLTAQ